MDLLNFIRNLHYKFSKNEVAKSCEMTLDSLRKHSLPTWKSAVALFTINKLQSPQGKSLQTDFNRLAFAGPLPIGVLQVLETAETMLDALQKKSETLFNDTEASGALSYRKASYVQLITYLNFLNDYSRRLLNYLYIVETAQADKEVTLQDQMVPAEIEYVESYFGAFCGVARIVHNGLKAVVEALDNLPEALVTQLSEETLPATLGSKALDPMGMRNLAMPVRVSVKCSPFYLIGSMVAAYQVASYKASKEEADLLQMRKLNLEKIYEKKPDPKLQQEINYVAERVTKLNYELEKAQEKYGV